MGTVNDDREMVTLPREALRALFDLVVNSMDFGSGFWEAADTDVARAVAAVLGIDPMEATPYDHRKNYEHTHVPAGWMNRGTVYRCKWCSLDLDPQLYTVPASPWVP